MIQLKNNKIIILAILMDFAKEIPCNMNQLFIYLNKNRRMEMEQFDILAMYYFLVSVRLNEWEDHLETFMKLSAKILLQRLQFTGKYLYNITVYVIPHRNIFVD